MEELLGKSASEKGVLESVHKWKLAHCNFRLNEENSKTGSSLAGKSDRESFVYLEPIVDSGAARKNQTWIVHNVFLDVASTAAGTSGVAAVRAHLALVMNSNRLFEAEPSTGEETSAQDVFLDTGQELKKLFGQDQAANLLGRIRKGDNLGKGLAMQAVLAAAKIRPASVYLLNTSGPNFWDANYLLMCRSISWDEPSLLLKVRTFSRGPVLITAADAVDHLDPLAGDLTRLAEVNVRAWKDVLATRNAGSADAVDDKIARVSIDPKGKGLNVTFDPGTTTPARVPWEMLALRKGENALRKVASDLLFLPKALPPESKPLENLNDLFPFINASDTRPGTNERLETAREELTTRWNWLREAREAEELAATPPGTPTIPSPELSPTIPTIPPSTPSPEQPTTTPPPSPEQAAVTPPPSPEQAAAVEVVDLRTQLEQKDRDLQKLLSESEAEKAELRATLATSEGSAKMYQRLLEQCKISEGKTKSDFDDVSGQLVKCLNDVRVQGDKLQEANSRIEAAEARQKEGTENLLRSATRFSREKDKADRLEMEATGLRAELKEVRSQSTELRGDLARAVKESEDARAASLLLGLTDLPKEQRDEALAESKRCFQERSRLRGEKNRLDARVVSLEEDLARAAADADNLGRKARDLKEANARLSQEMDAARSRADQADQAEKSLRGRAEDAEGNVDELRDTEKDLNAELVSQTSRASEGWSKAGREGRRATKAEEALASKDQELKKVQLAVADLRAQLERTGTGPAAAKKLRSIQEERRREIESRREELRRLTEDNQELRATNEISRTEIGRLHSEAESEVLKNTREQEDLRQLLTDLIRSLPEQPAVPTPAPKPKPKPAEKIEVVVQPNIMELAGPNSDARKEFGLVLDCMKDSKRSDIMWEVAFLVEGGLFRWAWSAWGSRCPRAPDRWYLAYFDDPTHDPKYDDIVSLDRVASPARGPPTEMPDRAVVSISVSRKVGVEGAASYMTVAKYAYRNRFPVSDGDLLLFQTKERKSEITGDVTEPQLDLILKSDSTKESGLTFHGLVFYFPVGA